MSRGSDRARRQRAQQIANGHAGSVDLSLAKLTDDEAWHTQARLELEMGMRCHGCGRRVVMGITFMSIDVKDPRQPVATRVACSRDDCDFAEVATPAATVMKMVEFAWVDELGADGPAFGLGLKPDGIDPEAAEAQDAPEGE